MAASGKGDAGGAPSKRKAEENPVDGQPQALSLDLIREAIRGEIKEAVGEFRHDMQTVTRRVDYVESQVTQKMQQTLNMLDEMQNRGQKHDEILEQLQEANREFHHRISNLEKGGGSAIGSTDSTSAPTWGEAKPPALVIGGWDADQDAATTKEEAENILRSVDAPIPAQGLFVPGVRRGYAILPVDERIGETWERRKTRIQDTINKVRAANVQLGQRPDGTSRKVWIALSQPPEKRRRARLAAKVKRLYLSLGGEKSILQMEYGSGSAWINAQKVCSATAPQPPNTLEAGPGWVDLDCIARAVGRSKTAVEKEWTPLAAEIH
ncbi:PLRG1 [Symbiodinium sp. CCMP2592]|nr:PLRG1 [Symbiodinium sp. CCMP2592]